MSKIGRGRPSDDMTSFISVDAVMFDSTVVKAELRKYGNLLEAPSKVMLHWDHKFAQSKYVLGVFATTEFTDWLTNKTLIDVELGDLQTEFDRICRDLGIADSFDGYSGDGYRDFYGQIQLWPFGVIPAGMTADMAANWWNAKSLEEKVALSELYGEALCELPGLDDWYPWIRERTHLSDLVSSSVSLQGEITANVPLKALTFSIGAAGEVVTSLLADGSVEVTLELSAEVGAKLEASAPGLGASAELGAGVTAGRALVYRFASEQEAEAFLAGLRDALVPDGVFETAVAVVRPETIGKSLADFLSEQQHPWDVLTYGGVFVEAGAEVDGLLGSASAGIRGDLLVTHSSASGDVQVSGSVEVEGSVDLMGVGAEVQMTGTITANFAPDRDIALLPDSISAEVTAEVRGGAMIDLLKSFGISDGGLDLSMTEGYRISIAADLPLDSESLGESVGSLIDSFKSGQPLTLSTLRELASSSYMKVSIEAVQEQSIGLDAEIVEAELTKRSTDTLVVFRKPVDGGWIVNLNP